MIVLSCTVDYLKIFINVIKLIKMQWWYLNSDIYMKKLIYFPLILHSDQAILFVHKYLCGFGAQYNDDQTLSYPCLIDNADKHCTFELN